MIFNNYIFAIGNIPQNYTSQLISYTPSPTYNIKITTVTFDDGEVKIALDPRHTPTLYGSIATIVLNTHSMFDHDIMLTQILCAALKNQYHIRSINIILPYLPSMRADKSALPFANTITCGALPFLLSNAGADNIITVTPHSQHAIQHWNKFFSISPQHPPSFVDKHLSRSKTTDETNSKHLHIIASADLFKNYLSHIAKHYGLHNICIGAPDGGNKPTDQGYIRASELAQTLFDTSCSNHMFFISKTRTDSHSSITNFKGTVNEKTAVIVDDIISTGRTILNAIKILKENGAKNIIVIITHAIFCNQDVVREIIITCNKLVISDTLGFPVTLQDYADKIDIVPSMPLVAKALEGISIQTSHTAIQELSVEVG